MDEEDFKQFKEDELRLELQNEGRDEELYQFIDDNKSDLYKEYCTEIDPDNFMEYAREAYSYARED